MLVIVFKYCVGACFVLVFCAPRNACDAEASFLNLLFSCMCCFYSLGLHGGVQGHMSELHNFFCCEHFD